MKNKKIKIIGLACLIVIGISLVLISIFLEFTNNANGALIGIGSGVIGASIAQLLTIKIYSKDPSKLKTKTIEVNDERNILIKQKAKSSTYKIFTYVLSIVLMSLVFMNLDSIWLFAAVSLYIIRFIIEIFFISKYMKEM